MLSRDEQGKLWGTCLVLIRKIPLSGSALMYAPRGPILDWTNKRAAADIFKGIAVISEKYRAYRFMCDPPFAEGEPRVLNELGFSHTINADECETVQPRANYLLRNIGRKTEEQLIAHFTPDYRNRVRKAIKKGVYDFGGIPHYNDESSPAYGLYRFKKGFNGEVEVYAGEYEYDFNPSTARFADMCADILLVCRERKPRRARSKSFCDGNKSFCNGNMGISVKA